MTWPKEGSLSSEIEQLLNQRIQSYIDENNLDNGGEDAQAVQKLIIDLYLIYKEADSPIDKFNLQQEIIHKGTSWDTEDPALAQSLEQLTKNCTSVVLNEFCRNNGLRVGGNKLDICSRVWRKLQGESSSEDESPRNKPKKSKKTSEKHKCSACTSKGLPCGSSATEQVGELWYCLRHISAASTSEVVEVEVDESEPELEAEPAPKKKSKIPKPGKKKV